MSSSATSNDKIEAGRCPACGAILPIGTPPAGCPVCLLNAGLQTQPTDLADGSVASHERRAPKALPQANEQFGDYRLIRLLGGGGMGVVYEAEETATSRRVALKLLSQKLDSPEARKRFLREGQLAAAINHPNCVYVYGTSEIAGTPAISMELMNGGTLQDRVAAGPLKISEAVDCTLQVIAGLDAAQRAGILHRDVKPSNCFIDGDGTVKIGDFGLSVSTTVRTEPTLTATGLVMGTPAFSSPEQLRGDDLTARSDIYSVGVTLYFLLTGKTPFHASNLVQMLATVLEKRPDSPGKWRSDLPVELCRVILRCLEKDAGERFANYSELQAALLPFSSSTPAPATLGRRFLAGFIDLTLIGAVAQLLESGIQLKFTPFYPLVVLYFALSEGWTGKSLGKRLLGLKIVSTVPRRFGWAMALARVVIFATTFFVFDLAIVLFLSHRHALKGGPASFISLTALATPLLLLFSTARLRNGWRGLHDLMARTRVVLESTVPIRGELTSDKPVPTVSDGARVGPYHLLERLGQTDQGEVFIGFDPRLLRKVWIHQVPENTPAVSAELRQLGRPGRLRWLAGRRSDVENWDAYEGLDGMALVDRIAENAGWDFVRFWLLDLATELNAQARDSALAALRLDRVWITEQGHAKLLDFNAPVLRTANAGGKPDSECEELAPCSDTKYQTHAFLLQVASSSLSGQIIRPNDGRIDRLSVPLPLHARSILERLKAGEDLAQIIQELKDSLTRPVVVTRKRRLFLFLAALWAPIFLTGIVLLADRAPRIQSSQGLAQLQKCLSRLESLPAESSDERNALETWIAGTFASTITNSWAMAQGSQAEIDRQQEEASEILRSHPRVTPNELATAKATIRQFDNSNELDGVDSVEPVASRHGWLWFTGLGSAYGALIVILPCWVASLAFRGGALLRGFGLVVVSRDGRLVSRGRLLWRNVLATAPFIIATLCLHNAEHFVAVLPLCLAVALGTASALLRGRTLQDRIAGTDLVTR